MLGSAWNAPSRSSTSHSPGGVCFCGSCSSTGQNRGAPASLRRYGHDEPVSPTGIPGMCGCLHHYAARSSEFASLFLVSASRLHQFVLSTPPHSCLHSLCASFFPYTLKPYLPSPSLLR